jgi:limonene-1,2-epoxide hydrolase
MMTGPTGAEQVVRTFFAEFGPTIDEMIAAAARWCHPDMYWASAGYDPPRVTSRAGLIADLEKARANKDVGGFRYELVHVAATGDIVLNERFDTMFDRAGNVAHEFRLMGIMGVRAGRIAWCRDYFYDTTQFARYLPEAVEQTAAPVLDARVRAGG